MASLQVAFLNATIVSFVPKLIAETSDLHANFAEVMKSDPSFTSWFHSRPYLLTPPVYAWCNAMRRLRLEDLGDLWNVEETKRVKSLPFKTLEIVERTNEIRDDWCLYDTHLTDDTSVISDAARKSEQSHEDLKFFIAFLEASDQMDLVKKIIFERHIDAGKWIEQQLLMFVKGDNPFEVAFIAAQEVIQVLVEIGKTEWEPVLRRCRVWASGPFDKEVTIDAIMADPDAIDSELGDEVVAAFAKIVFHISEAIHSTWQPGIDTDCCR